MNRQSLFFQLILLFFSATAFGMDQGSSSNSTKQRLSDQQEIRSLGALVKQNEDLLTTAAEHFNRGLMLQNSKPTRVQSCKPARGHYRMAAQIADQAIEVCANLANLIEAAQSTDQTIEKYAKDAKSDAQGIKAGTNLNIGKAYYNEQMYQKALPYFMLVTQLSPAPEYNEYIAEANLSLGEIHYHHDRELDYPNKVQIRGQGILHPLASKYFEKVLELSTNPDQKEKAEKCWRYIAYLNAEYQRISREGPGSYDPDPDWAPHLDLF